MTKKFSVPQALLVLAALLAPVFGGYVASDSTAVGPSGLLAAMGEGQAPILQHALLALLTSGAMVLLLLGRRVQQIPYPYVAGTLLFLVVALAPSVAVSSYRAVSINVWMEWVVYAVAFLAAVAGLGRRVGPVVLLAAAALGTAWIARLGVFEYLEMRRIDPTWRVFCNWSNPNAAAGMLTLGFLCALGLPVLKERSANLLANLGVVVGGGLILCALALTGSKGGALLAMPTGLVILGLLVGRRDPVSYVGALFVLAFSAVVFVRPNAIPGVGSLLGFLPLLALAPAVAFAVAMLASVRLPVGRLAGAFALGCATLLFFASTTPRAQGAPAVATTGGSRIAAAATTQDQSATFRLNLWKSAAALAKERPISGWGLGSYRYESARPGLVTTTVFAHNTYLQFAAEAGVGALALFVGFLGLWARRAFRGSSRLPVEGRLAFAAGAGGAASVVAHSLVDSDFSYFGLGLMFFLVLGAATNLAADAVAPEFVPRPSRIVAAASIAALAGLFLYLGDGDLAKGGVRFAQKKGDRDASSIEGLTGWDGDAAYLWAVAQTDPEPGLRRAFELQPTPKIARSLAKVRERRGDFVAAEAALFPALDHDPNNLRTLYVLMELQQEAGDADAARTTARRIVAVEEKPVFRIRALDQLVPTETYLARVVLAADEADPVRKAALYADCARGIGRYAALTVPEVVRAAKEDPNGNYAGESLADARKKLGIGLDAARVAAKLYGSLGDARAAAMAKQAAALERALPD